MKRLYPGIFSFHFRNLRYASGRNCSFLCFQVRRMRHPSPVPSDRGVFRNQVWGPLLSTKAGTKPVEDAEKIPISKTPVASSHTWSYVLGPWCPLVFLPEPETRWPCGLSASESCHPARPPALWEETASQNLRACCASAPHGALTPLTPPHS